LFEALIVLYNLNTRGYLNKAEVSVMADYLITDWSKIKGVDMDIIRLKQFL